MTASSGGGQNAPFNGAVHSLADKSNHRHSRQGTSAKSSPMNPAEPAAYKHENSLLIAGDENLSVDDVVAAIKTKRKNRLEIHNLHNWTHILTTHTQPLCLNSKQTATNSQE